MNLPTNFQKKIIINQSTNQFEKTKVIIDRFMMNFSTI